MVKSYEYPAFQAVYDNLEAWSLERGVDPGDERRYRKRELAAAALCYVNDGGESLMPPPQWPLPAEYWIPEFMRPFGGLAYDERRRFSLARAAALLLAEHMRVDPVDNEFRYEMLDFTLRYTVDGIRQCSIKGPLRNRIIEDKLVRAIRANISMWIDHQEPSRCLLDGVADIIVLMDFLAGEPVFDNTKQ